ncbi:MAG: 5-formyltetrahydrofolate cyclo-ligase, partial [Hyphomicrobiales bacterium]
MHDAGSRDSLAGAKRAARAEAAGRRRAIGRERRVAGADKVAGRGLDFLPRPHGGPVAAYVAFRDEIDPMPLLTRLADAGVRTALPCVVAKGQPLVFRAWKPGDELAGAAHGIPAPRGDASLVTPQVLLVPLLAFDAQGHRLGYGGGYY